MGERLDRLEMSASFVRRDVNPSLSVTKHTFDSYFIEMTEPKDALGRVTKSVFEAMYLVDAAINEPLRGQSFVVGNTSALALRPQIIHYPQGGGFFAWHSHERMPQGYGLILNLSQPGVDYQSGSTCFKIDDQDVSINDVHGFGALALFRFDLLHMVEAIQPSSAHQR